MNILEAAVGLVSCQARFASVGASVFETSVQTEICRKELLGLGGGEWAQDP